MTTAIPPGNPEPLSGKWAVPQLPQPQPVPPGADPDPATGDVITAILLKLTRHTEQLAALGGQLTQLAATAIRQAAIVSTLETLDREIAALAERITRLADARAGHGDGEHDDGYQPVPAPRWWSLVGPERENAIARIRAWVEQVYRPGYGHHAATLAPCWDQHSLCLYGLDWLMELWSVLYLSPAREPPDLASQAEFQTRILPALADQLHRETNRCPHRLPTTGGPGRPIPGSAHPGSRPQGQDPR